MRWICSIKSNFQVLPDCPARRKLSAYILISAQTFFVEGRFTFESAHEDHMQGGRILVASAAVMFAVAIVAIESPAFAQTQPSAAERLNTPGPEAES
jgi:hypothetical protein